MSEYSFGASEPGGQQGELADALLLASLGDWEAAAAEVCARTGLREVGEDALRESVRQVAAGYHLQPDSDENLASVLYQGNIVSLQHFGPFLGNPFAQEAPNPHQNEDPALACLHAIIRDDWDDARERAAWAAGTYLTTEALTDALCATATALNINLQAYSEIPALAADLAAFVSNDATSFHHWQTALTTHHPAQTHGTVAPEATTAPADLYMWQGPAVEEGTAPAWDPAGTASDGIWAPGDLAQLMDMVDEVNHTMPQAPAPVPAPGTLTANDLYTLAAIHHTGTLTPQIQKLASSLYITSGAVRDRLETLGRHIQVLNAELILTGLPEARAAQVAGWLREGAIPGVVANALPWPPPRHELTKDDHHTIAAIRQSGSLKPTVATLATTLGINQSAMESRLEHLGRRLGMHGGNIAARVADMLQRGQIPADAVNGVNLPIPQDPEPVQAPGALTANDLYLLAAIHRTGSLTPRTRDLASSLYITTPGVGRRLETLGQHLKLVKAELVPTGPLAPQVALWLREGAIPGVVANALPWPPPRHELTKDDYNTIAAIRQSGSLNPAVATLATTLGITTVAMNSRLKSLSHRLGIQDKGPTERASQIAAMLQRGEIPA